LAIGKNQYGCAATSRLLTVTMFENPKPKINLIKDTLFSDTYGPKNQYQWFLKGIEMAGETNYFVVPKETGAYKILVTDSNG